MDSQTYRILLRVKFVQFIIKKSIDDCAAYATGQGVSKYEGLYGYLDTPCPVALVADMVVGFVVARISRRDHE